MDSGSGHELSDARVQRALSIIHSAPFTPGEHRLLSSFVRDSVSPEVMSLYLIERVSKDEPQEQHDERELRRLLLEWKCVVERCKCTGLPI